MSDDIDIFNMLDESVKPVETAPREPNEILYSIVLAAGSRRAMLKMWLESTLRAVYFLTEDGVLLSKTITTLSKGTVFKRLDRSDIALILIEHYIEIHHIKMFREFHTGREKEIDIKKVAAMVAIDPEIAVIIKREV